MDWNRPILVKISGLQPKFGRQGESWLLEPSPKLLQIVFNWKHSISEMGGCKPVCRHAWSWCALPAATREHAKGTASVRDWFGCTSPCDDSNRLYLHFCTRTGRFESFDCVFRSEFIFFQRIADRFQHAGRFPGRGAAIHDVEGVMARYSSMNRVAFADRKLRRLRLDETPVSIALTERVRCPIDIVI